MEAHHRCNADTNVAIAGEITINLYGIAKDAHHALETRIGWRTRENPVVVLRNVVGYYTFLEKSDHYKPQSHVEASLRNGRGFSNLWQQHMGSGDRSGQEQREEREIEKKLEERDFHREPATIHINYIADGLEGEERNADGQRYFQQTEVACYDRIE